MKNIGYKFVSEHDYNQIYIDEAVYDMYMAKYEIGVKKLNDMKILNSKRTLIEFYQKIKVP